MNRIVRRLRGALTDPVFLLAAGVVYVLVLFRGRLP